MITVSIMGLVRQNGYFPVAGVQCSNPMLYGREMFDVKSPQASVVQEKEEVSKEGSRTTINVDL